MTDEQERAADRPFGDKPDAVVPLNPEKTPEPAPAADSISAARRRSPTVLSPTTRRFTALVRQVAVCTWMSAPTST